MTKSSIYSYSIIVCTYNRLKLLKNTLESIKSLTIPPNSKVELIIVDNNSNDGTKEYCSSIINYFTFPYKYVFEQMPGLSNARNRGLVESSNNILVFTDDDIIVPTDWISNYIKVFNETKADCLFGRINAIWPYKLLPKWYNSSFDPIFGILDYGFMRMEIKTRRYEFFGANFALKKDVLINLGGFNPKLGRQPDKLYISEETRIFFDLLKNKNRIIYEPMIFLDHIITENMLTKQYLIKYFKDTAYSEVLSIDRKPNRQIMGIPYFRIIEMLKFFILFIPKFFNFFFRKKESELFVLKLKFIRNIRMVLLYLSNIFKQNDNFFI